MPHYLIMKLSPDCTSRGSYFAEFGVVATNDGSVDPQGMVVLSLSAEPPHMDALCSAVGGDVTCDDEGDDTALFKSAVQVVDPPEHNQNEVVILVVDYPLAAACLDWGGEFFKADHGPIPPGARWITVHPNGPGSKGTPILVEPVKDGSGHMRVIAGAGGKLNMLKLRGLKSGEELKTKHAERALAKRARLKDQVRRDKELGIHDAKVGARKDLNEQRRKAERGFIETVAEAMGWPADALHPETEGLSAPAAKKAEADHHRNLLAKAKAAVNAQRTVLVADAERRAQAGLSRVPLAEVAEALTAQDRAQFGARETPAPWPLGQVRQKK